MSDCTGPRRLWLVHRKSASATEAPPRAWERCIQLGLDANYRARNVHAISGSPLPASLRSARFGRSRWRRAPLTSGTARTGPLRRRDPKRSPPWPACGAAAPSLDLGTGIVPLQVRSPLLAAMGAATLQALHPDRSDPARCRHLHAADHRALARRPLCRCRTARRSPASTWASVRQLSTANRSPRQGPRGRSRRQPRRTAGRDQAAADPRRARIRGCWLSPANWPTACSSTICRPATSPPRSLGCGPARPPRAGRRARAGSTPTSTWAWPTAKKPATRPAAIFSYAAAKGYARHDGQGRLRRRDRGAAGSPGPQGPRRRPRRPVGPDGGRHRPGGHRRGGPGVRRVLRRGGDRGAGDHAVALGPGPDGGHRRHAGRASPADPAYGSPAQQGFTDAAWTTPRSRSTKSGRRLEGPARRSERADAATRLSPKAPFAMSARSWTWAAGRVGDFLNSGRGRWD